LQGNIEIYITEALSKWEPRISVKDITVKNLPEFNKTIVTLGYVYKDRGLVLNERLNINLSA
jgi:phage baseplate assembly protein W